MLGKKIIDLLNVPFFSPRNTASKFNLISPLRLAKNMMESSTRPVAYLPLRDATQGLTTLGTTLGLMHFAGLDVGHDPRSPDFGKLRVGKAVYDLTGGEAYSVRFLSLMAQAAAKKDGKTMEALTRRYLRTQLQPASGSAVDWWTGKTIEGKPVTSASAALDMITPFVVDDVVKGFRAEGVLGAAKATPGVLGVGVNFYDKPKQGRGAGDAASAPSSSPVPTPAATPAPQLNLDGIVEPDARAPVPESPETLRQQFKSADSEESTRVGVLVTPGERPRRVPQGFARVMLEDGALYLNKRKLKAAGLARRGAVEDFIARNGFEPLIGKVAPVADTSKGVALRTEDANGTELSTSIVPDTRAAVAQAAEDRAQFPHAARHELGTAQEMAARRVEGAAPPEHGELRRIVDAASADSEPAFRAFPEGMSDPNIPRASMPQVMRVHRGAMVQFLKGRGIAHTQEEVPAGSLRPSQAEWSPEKVKRALSHEGPERSILVSSDGYVADGHHQWLAAVHSDPRRPIRVIRLYAPIRQLLLEMARFPSSGVDDASA